jgi:ABC-type uncharacterized transport system substrate-binding protein
VTRRAALIVVVVCLAAPLWAHPHVFIADRLTVVFDKGVLQGISFEWTFDDVFSSMILTDYNPKHNAQLTEAQNAAIKAGAFDNLVSYHYFLAFWIGGKPLKSFSVERFTAIVKDGRTLVYTFFVPLNVPVHAAEQTVLATVYDDSYYVAFDILKTDAVTVQADADVTCSLSIQKTKVKPEWPGQYMPDQLVIAFKETP